MNSINKIIPEVFSTLTYEFGEEKIIYDITFESVMAWDFEGSPRLNTVVKFNRQTPKTKVTVANRVLNEHLWKEMNDKCHYLGVNHIHVSLSKDISKTECI
jgi:hypothetical protein